MSTLLVLGMMVTGCANTLLLKYQDEKCTQTGAACSSFPLLQSVMMFLGESLCLLVILARRQDYTLIQERPLRGSRIFWLSVPAALDICGTTTSSIGLLFVPASVFQMIRGSIVLCVALLSVLFLGRKLVLYQWVSLVVITAGVALVGLASLESHGSFRDTLFGVLMIAGAQVFTASQFVVEEWVLGRYSVEPLKVAGLEGVFGTTLTTIGITIAYYSYGRTLGSHGTFDVSQGLAAIATSDALKAAFIVFAVTIAAFNFFGLTVTRTVSATSRSTIDTCRTLVIWLVSMALGWESFKVLQLIGFTLLVYATLVFNGAIRPPGFLQDRRPAEVDTTVPHTLE